MDRKSKKNNSFYLIILCLLIIAGIICYFMIREKEIYTTFDTVTINQKLPSDVKTYKTADDALKSWDEISKNRTTPFYLRHIIKNNKIKESYIDFVVTKNTATNAKLEWEYRCETVYTGLKYNSKEECLADYEDMTPGIYTLKGDIYDSTILKHIEPNEVYLDNKKTLLTAFGKSNCMVSSDETYISCSISGLSAYADDGGMVTTTGYDFLTCEIDYNGTSHCWQNK